jgi:IS605 OrfB family transposase
MSDELSPSKVVVNRAFKFRLYPTSAQDAELRECERQLRFLYNLAHEQRLMALSRPRDERPRVDYFRQSREMTELIREGDLHQLGRVVCCARQEILRDLDKAWQRWRKRLGGRPRFKRKTDTVRIYLSTIKHWGISGEGKKALLSLAGAASSVGKIEMRFDRPFPKDAKASSCHLVRDVDQWFAVFPLEFSVEISRPKSKEVGLNRGAVHAIADSDGGTKDSPKYYANAMAKIAARSRDLDRKVPHGQVPKPSPTKYGGFRKEEIARIVELTGVTPGRAVYEAKTYGLDGALRFLCRHTSKEVTLTPQLPSLGRNRERSRVRLATTHRKVRRQREWFLHDLSSHYTSTYRMIAIEDWSTKDMTAKEPDETFPTREVKKAINRSILDVGWYEFARQIKYKVETHGGEVREVPMFDPEGEKIGISSVCSVCGAALGGPASGRKTMRCEDCAHSELGDLNAARNVLIRATEGWPSTPKPAKQKTSIKIKGRQKRPETAGNSSVDAPGRDPSVRGPDEGGTHERTVLTSETEETHPPMRDAV